VILRILEEVKDPRLQGELVEDVNKGLELSNPAAAKVYDLETERGVGPIKQMVIGPHAQYRMDLRQVTVPLIRVALDSFLKQFFLWKSRQDPQYKRHADDLNSGEPIQWVDPKLQLAVVFAGAGSGRVKIVTTYWKGEPDPKPPKGLCTLAGYRPPTSELPGQQTFVENPDGTQKTTPENERVLPSPPWSRSKPTRKPEFNTPGESGSAPDGRSIHKDKVRTPGTPGGEDDHPWVDNASQGYKQRRVDVTAAVNGPRFPGTHRQHEQKGEARTYYKKRYRENRNEMKMRSRKWYRTQKTQTLVKKDKERRREQPEKFERYPGGGATSIAERGEREREKQKLHFKKQAFDPKVVLLSDGQEGLLLDVDLDQGFALVEMSGMPVQVPLDSFLDEMLVGQEEDLDPLFDYLDQAFEYTEDAKTADFLYEKRPPDVPPEQKFDRGKPPLRWPGHAPSENTGPDYQVEDNPGSAKVIPYNKDLVNNKAAMRISEIVDSCSPELVRKSMKVPVKLRKVDAKNNLWLFDVKGSKGDAYRVRVKASSPKANVRDPGKMDVVVSCSCPFWQWQGPEHWASQKGYLYGKPTGTASAPDVKDPEEKHGACKHVLAVLRQVAEYSMPKPKGRLASLDLLMSHLRGAGNLWITSEDDIVLQGVVARYLERKGGA
jgi:hypothetical protein